jgi:hypothetical protein
MGYQNSAKKFNTITGATIRDKFITETNQDINDTFFDMPEYESVLIGLDQVNSADTLIYARENYLSLSTGKEIIFHPDTDVSLIYEGVYIYPQRQGNTCILTSLDSQYSTYLRGELNTCTKTLKWYDKDGNLIERPVYIKNLKSGNEETMVEITTLNGMRSIDLPIDEDTEKIVYRFRHHENILFPVVSERAVYRLVSLNASESDTIMNWRVELYPFNDDKVDWENGVLYANFDEELTLTLLPSSTQNEIGETVELQATVVDESNEVLDKDLIWSSSDETIATVDTNGNVTTISLGSCTITCSLEDNTAIYDTCSIEVVASSVADYEYQISPNQNVLRLSELQLYNVQLLDNGQPTVDTFTITVDGSSTAESTAYYFEQTGNDTFKLRNIEGSGIVTIKIVGTLYTDYYNITLKEGF